MLEGGEDPRFILRRLVVVASEDVGNADPAALPLAIAARDAYEMLGRPEGDIAIGQLTAYLAAAPKSNRAHVAFKAAKQLARESGSLAPPPARFERADQADEEFGVCGGVFYDHGVETGFAGLNYFPPDLTREAFYRPRSVGAEAAIARRMEAWARAPSGRQDAMKDDDGEHGHATHSDEAGVASAPRRVDRAMKKSRCS